MARPYELDVIELTAEVDGRPAGTIGTVVDDHGDSGLIEVSDDRGRTLDLFEAPYDATRVVTPAPAR